MSDKGNGFFWGIVVGVAAVVVAGALALTRSFRTSRDGGRTLEKPVKGMETGKKGKGKSKGKAISKKEKEKRKK